MQALRTEENDSILRYFEVVQDYAKKQNSVFFMEFGQCDDIAFEDMKLDSLSGWLIPNDMADNMLKIT